MTNPARAQKVQASPGSGAALRIRGVEHGFDLESGPLAVLEALRLDVEPGEFVVLLGPSGCGKSTLLRLIAGLEPPRAGEIRVDEALVAGPGPSGVAAFQDPTLYPWRTVRKTVALGMGAEAESRRVEEALRLVGLQAVAEAYPHQLSGGMAQRASLARALAEAPRLLLLDEPFGALDAATRRLMQAELIALWRRLGFTALLATRDAEEAFLLGQRVAAFSRRPARMLREFRNPLPYPRRRDDPALTEQSRAALAEMSRDASW